MTDDPFACQTLDCGFLAVRTLEECEKAKCPWAYVRRREKDRQQQQEKDAEGALSPDKMQGERT